MKAKRNTSRAVGFAIFFSSIFLFFLYAYLLLATQWTVIILEITVLAALAAIVAVFAWIGFTMATAPRT